jgi:hypothetical protein
MVSGSVSDLLRRVCEGVVGDHQQDISSGYSGARIGGSPVASIIGVHHLHPLVGLNFLGKIPQRRIPHNLVPLRLMLPLRIGRRRGHVECGIGTSDFGMGAMVKRGVPTQQRVR